jgi:hypothetical protein
MNTVARVSRESTARFYTKAGEPCFEIPKKSGNGMKSPTIRDAREMELLPSVTHLIRTLNRPELNEWITEQCVLAVLTTPRKPGETDDEFVRRVLHEERIQDQEVERARKMGNQIHAALEDALNMGLSSSPNKAMAPYVDPVLQWRMKVGRVVWAERILVGEGYAGKADLLLDLEDINFLQLIDFKTTSRLPKASYHEHRLQTSAYAKAADNNKKPILHTANVYISTVDPGKFVVHCQDNWENTYNKGFKPLMELWQWMNGYNPNEQ